MNLQRANNQTNSWTWADLISTYRFWGLLVFFAMTMVSFTILKSFLTIYLTDVLELQISETGIIHAIIAIAGLYGFYLAWAIVRWKTHSMLILMGVLQLIGTLLLTLPGLASITALRYGGAFMLGLVAGIISLSVPAIIAGGQGGAEVFLLSFGLFFLSTQVGDLAGPTLIGFLWNDYGSSSLATILIIISVMGLLFLIPIKPSLFSQPPAPRGHPLPPTHRDPFMVALSCLIPFYWLYWLYKAHGEVTAMAPSRSILSPGASLLASILVPFFITPVILTTLNDALNQHAALKGQPAYRSSWIIALWSFFFYPVALGLVQSTMNTVASELKLQEQNAQG